MTIYGDLWSKVDATGPCWLWLAAIDGQGYGAINRDGKVQRAHRYVWTFLVGPIPAGAQLDHLCRIRRCVNPDHLDVVTNAENARRGTAASRNRERLLAVTHCKHGHPFDKVVHRSDGTTERRCSVCSRAATARYHKRKKAE